MTKAAESGYVDHVPDHLVRFSMWTQQWTQPVRRVFDVPDPYAVPKTVDPSEPEPLLLPAPTAVPVEPMEMPVRQPERIPEPVQR